MTAAMQCWQSTHRRSQSRTIRGRRGRRLQVTLTVRYQCSDGAALTAAQALAPVATDNCDVTLTPVKTAGLFAAGTCPQAGTYTNTWTVSDDCGNAVLAVYTQTITVTDNTRPTWTTVAGNLDRTVSCSDGAALTAAQALAPVATDNCDVTLTPVKTTGLFVAGTCPQAGTYTNTWTVSDDCGNAVRQSTHRRSRSRTIRGRRGQRLPVTLTGR